jgi:hypothetical protein
MTEPLKKSFVPNKKELNYLSKDFQQYKDNLIQYSKTYFPNTFKDFSDASPGMLFIEQAAAIGDVLSYYIDSQLQESFIQYAQERKNIIALARMLGYKPKVSTPAISTLEVFQLVPAKQNSDGSYNPDLTYALSIASGMTVSNSDNSVYYRTNSPINFSTNTSNDPTDISVYKRDANGVPLFFLLRKTIKASSGQTVSRNFTIGDPQEFYKITLPDTNVIEILNVTDSDLNIWYEVENLAQDLVTIDQDNTSINDSRYFQYYDTVPFILQTLRTSRRFITNINDDNTTYLEFGPGLDIYDDEIVVPNLDTVGRGLFNSKNLNGISYDPSNFLKSTNYGKAPSNTILTVNYVVGGGLSSNVNSNELTTITNVTFTDNISEYSNIEQSLVNSIRQTLSVNNIEAGVGGSDAESNDSIKLNALANFGSQKRAVTKDDYVVRVYSMPQKYGSIAKVYVNQDGKLDVISNLNYLGTNSGSLNTPFTEINNPLAINMYVLGFDNNKKLTTVNDATKQNLRTFLEQYRMLTDGINILDGFVINIGVDFEIITYKNQNKKDVLANCIVALTNFFNIDNFTFNQPINISSIELEIAKIEGVQSVNSVTIRNLTIADGDYSKNEYNIEQATINNIVYPSLDPSVFEVKFPSRDLRGKAL